ncbi:MAG: protein kinase [Myxococcales bacterium]|nr:protein kinase [Myxococcales bacterium]
MNAGLDRIDYDPGDLPPGVAPGAVIAGKYRLDHVIGMGGMGSVWQATHIGINQPVALKIVSPEFARSTEARRRFDTEAKAAAQLRSRHVVAISDNGELADGTPFMAMELLHGEPLGKRIHKFGPLPVLDALRVVIQVGRALGKAHAVGIVHRDVKPENIFLATHDEEPGYVAKVLDFGIAKVRATNAGEQSATRTGSLLGTPLYMSPEQARALKTVDHRSDIYSLGLVVYTMLTGNLAFSGESYADVIVQICTMPLPTIRGSAPWIPEQVDQWLQYACAKEQENRYQDVQSMVDALCVACGYPPGSPELAQPIGPGQPAFPYAGTVPLMPSRDDVLGPANPHAAQSSGGFPTPGPILTPGPLPPPPTPPPGYVSPSQAPPAMGPPMGPRPWDHRCRARRWVQPTRAWRWPPRPTRARATPTSSPPSDRWRRGSRSSPCSCSAVVARASISGSSPTAEAPSRAASPRTTTTRRRRSRRTTTTRVRRTTTTRAARRPRTTTTTRAARSPRTTTTSRSPRTTTSPRILPRTIRRWRRAVRPRSIRARSRRAPPRPSSPCPPPRRRSRAPP